MTGLRDRRVLIVEDDYYLASDAAQILKFVGAEVVGPFSRKQDALVAIALEQPDCVLLDINLGQGADFSLADFLMARGTTFLFFTGYDCQAIPARFKDVIQLRKPVRAKRLTSALETLSPNERDRRR